MIVKKEIIERIQGRKDIKQNLRLAFNVNRMTVYHWLKVNKPHSPLTTITAANIISSALQIQTENIYDQSHNNAT
jgi:hypothetical protein